ncbi:hypothetical protein EGW08_006253 [Elysia chlorotica]|uniref:Uncharacterized protein n=1 Tax=Elysia chlorotica TaxID=188477 RepID=A0A3S1BKN3_ELYCH|nr:hypothetical protein EGW08_006253 [Elysia chlorotica]
MTGTRHSRSNPRPAAAMLDGQVAVALTLLFCCLLMSGTGNTFAADVAVDVSNNSSLSVLVINVTDTPTDVCPEASCGGGCGGAVAGAVVASLIVGLVTGALATYLVQRYLKKRRRSIPPKDYTNTESSALDVNMNNGEGTARDSGDVSPPEDVPQVKGHKKLERLSKQGPKPIIGPKPVLGQKGKPNPHSGVQTPLIYLGPRNEKPDSRPSSAPSLAVQSEEGRRSAGLASLQQPSSSPAGDDEGGGSDDEADQGNVYQDVDYTNIGLDAALSQPYDSLDVIPEEVEYANTQEYEQLGLVS